MSGRQVLLYFSWSRPGETQAPLTVIEDRFPAVFELRRLFFPKFEELDDPGHVDPGIAGFLDHVQKRNFEAFAQQALAQTGRPVLQAERVADDGGMTLLDERLIDGADTIVVISFDSLRTHQVAAPTEIGALRRFLDNPDHLVFVCPHHDIGETALPAGEARLSRQLAEFLHHGDRAIPPRQGFGGYARTLLTGLEVPVENRFGLRPATEPDGRPAAAQIERSLDRLGLLEGVEALNLHPHLPQLERIGAGMDRMDVLARQRIDPSAPAHPFTAAGRQSFDAILQSRAGTFPGTLLVSDTTLWSSTAGGLDDLRRLWSNVVLRARR